MQKRKSGQWMGGVSAILVLIFLLLSSSLSELRFYLKLGYFHSETGPAALLGSPHKLQLLYVL